MIDNKKYEEILDEGLIMDHYFVMCNIKNGVEPVKNKRIQGFVNLLEKKGYISQGILTEKALKVLEDCQLPEEVVAVEKKKSQKTINMGEWAMNVHPKCEAKLMSLMKVKQVKPRINGKTYSYLPNQADLAKKLLKIVEQYRLKDLDKIERTLLAYIEKSYNEKSWFPIVEYYVSKFSASPLVTDMNDIDDQVKEGKGEQFTIIKNKDLFE